MCVFILTEMFMVLKICCRSTHTYDNHTDIWPNVFTVTGPNSLILMDPTSAVGDCTQFFIWILSKWSTGDEGTIFCWNHVFTRTWLFVKFLVIYQLSLFNIPHCRLLLFLLLTYLIYLRNRTIFSHCYCNFSNWCFWTMWSTTAAGANTEVLPLS